MLPYGMIAGGNFTLTSITQPVDIELQAQNPPDYIYLRNRSAWGDGEPYVRRYELARTTELLQQMQVPIPNLPPYNPDKDAPIPWAAEVRAAINKLRDEKQAN